jgi:hypothetical protein
MQFRSQLLELCDIERVGWINRRRKYPAHFGFHKFQAFPILNIFVPQEGQVPWVAGLPFFIVIDFGSLISLFVRHFIQYACISSTSLFDMI